MKKDDDIKLISLVKDRPLLWDQEDVNYNNNHLKNKAWEEILPIVYPNKDFQQANIRKEKYKWTRRIRDLKKNLENYTYYAEMKFLLKNPRPPISLVAHPTNEEDKFFKTNLEPPSIARMMYEDHVRRKEMKVNEDVLVKIEVEDNINNDNASSHYNLIERLPRDIEEDQQASPSKRLKPTPSPTDVIEIEDDVESIPNESPFIVKRDEENKFSSIIPVSYPESKLTEEQGTAIGMAITNKFEEMEDGNYPRFSDTYIERGALIMKCSNEMTRQWLDKLVKANFMPLGESIQLIVGLSKDILKPNRVVFEAPAKLSVFTREKIFDMLVNQNPALKIREWNVLSEKHETRGRSFVCSVNDKCLNVIKSLNCMAHVALWKVPLATDDVESMPNEIQNPFIVKGDEENMWSAIIPVSHPESKLTEEQGTDIEMAIINKLKEMEDGNYPRFSDTYIERGALIIKCSNEMTRQWLDKLVNANFMPLGESIQLIVGLSKDILKPNRVVFEAPAKLSVYTREKVFEMLVNQNPALKIREWNVLSGKHETGGHSFVWSVNDECLNVIKSLNCMAHVALWEFPLDTDDGTEV